MKDKLFLNLELELCDRNRNFGEILEGILKMIRDRDGVEDIIILREDFANSTNAEVKRK